MIYAIAFTLLCPISMWLVFFFLYNRLKGDTTRYQPVWIIGVVLDLYVNLTWGTMLFLQFPSIYRGFLSARMDEIIKNGSTGWAWVVRWRTWLAVQIVGRLLEPYDKTKQHSTYGKFKQ